MDLTWTFYRAGYAIRFVPDAVCYPIEPHTHRTCARSSGVGRMASFRTSGCTGKACSRSRSCAPPLPWRSGTRASHRVAYLLALPVLALVMGSFWPLLGYVIDAPAILVPVLVAAKRRQETWKALTSLPAFFVLRAVNAVFFIRALWLEVAMNRPLLVYEKGH